MSVVFECVFVGWRGLIRLVLLLSEKFQGLWVPLVLRAHTHTGSPLLCVLSLYAPPYSSSFLFISFVFSLPLFPSTLFPIFIFSHSSLQDCPLRPPKTFLILSKTIFQSTFFSLFLSSLLISLSHSYPPRSKGSWILDRLLVIVSDTTGLNFDLQPSSLHPCPLMGLHFSAFPHSPHFLFFLTHKQISRSPKKWAFTKIFPGWRLSKKKKVCCSFAICTGNRGFFWLVHLCLTSSFVCSTCSCDFIP